MISNGYTNLYLGNIGGVVWFLELMYNATDGTVTWNIVDVNGDAVTSTSFASTDKLTPHVLGASAS